MLLRMTVTDVLFTHASITLISLQTQLIPVLTMPVIQVLPPVRQKLSSFCCIYPASILEKPRFPVEWITLHAMGVQIQNPDRATSVLWLLIWHHYQVCWESQAHPGVDKNALIPRFWLLPTSLKGTPQSSGLPALATSNISPGIPASLMAKLSW